MIEVGMGGTNYFTIKGNCVVEGEVARHTLGWTIRWTLRVGGAGSGWTQEAERLHDDAVIPTMKETLETWKIEEPINEEEIRTCMGYAQDAYQRTERRRAEAMRL